MEQKDNAGFVDELFRRKLEGYELPIREEVWDRVDQGMSARRMLSRKKRVLSVAAAAMLGCLVAGFWLVGREAKEEFDFTTSFATSDGREFAFGEESAGGQASPGFDGTDLEELSGSGGAATYTEARFSDFSEAGVPANRSLSIEETDKVSSRSFSSTGKREHLTTPEPTEEQTLTFSQNRAITDTPSESSAGGSRVLVVYVVTTESDPEPVEEKLASVVVTLAGEDTMTGSPEVKEKRRGGVQRLWRQLRNAKSGEKIDWEELGLHSQRSVANVEHNPQD